MDEVLAQENDINVMGNVYGVLCEMAYRKGGVKKFVMELTEYYRIRYGDEAAEEFIRSLDELLSLKNN